METWYFHLGLRLDIILKVIKTLRTLDDQNDPLLPTNPMDFGYLNGLLEGEWKGLFTKIVKKAISKDNCQMEELGNLFVEVIKFLKTIPFPQEHRLKKADFIYCFNDAGAKPEEYNKFLELAFSK